MAKKRKPMSEEQKQHLRDLALQRSQNKNPQQKVEQPDIKQGQTISQSDYADLLRQIEELKANQFTDLIKALRSGDSEAGASASGGRLTGTFEKYVTAAEKYPDPSERISVEQRLARFAFPLNYELVYEVGISEYETIDHIRTKEPKFNLTLVRKWLDEDTGEDIGRRYEICRLVMHEDPDAALVIARDNNYEVEQEDEETFLNEMRYIRMRDWVFECFYPAPISKKHDKKDMVIEGKLVTYYEVNNAEGTGVQKLDWDTISQHKL